MRGHLRGHHRKRLVWGAWGLAALLMAGCGGGGGDDGPEVPNNHPEDRSGCLNRYDALKASMNEGQLSSLLGEATYKTHDGDAKDGKLLGLGWLTSTYDNGLKCSFLVGMDKQGAYSKGVTGEGFTPRSEVLRNFVPF